MKKMICILLFAILISNFVISVCANDYDYNIGYENGYYDGFNDGKEEGIREEKARYEEIRDNQKGAMCTIAVAIGIPVVLGYIDKRKHKKN